MKEISEELSVPEAARALRVSERRVRAMIRDGVLAGRRLGRLWLVRSADIEQRVRTRSHVGRPMSERNAWAVLSVLSSGKWPALPRWDRTRLGQKVRRKSLLALADDLRGRAEPKLFRADPRVLERIARDPLLVRSGVSAAADYDVDVRAPGVLEGYVARAHLSDLVYRYVLRPAAFADANLILHVVQGRVPESEQRRAPVAAVVLDLIESPDARSRRAGRELARRLR